MNLINKPKAVVGEKKTDAIVEEPDAVEEEFTANELKEEWLKYAEDNFKSNKVRLYSVMINSIPEISDKNTLFLNLTNESQKINFNEVKADIINYLRKKLNNSKLELKIQLAKFKSKEKHIYTEEDKLKYLMEKHPELSTMKQKLGLDFE